jgi:hypothetical protein
MSKTLKTYNSTPPIDKEKKIARKRNNLESKLQRACIKWFKYQYPQEVIFAIPNGGKRSKIEAAIMKGEGVLQGVSDLFVMSGKNGYNGLFMEMKTGSNKLSPLQKEFIKTAQDKGYKAEVCYSFEEFIEKVTEYLN